MSYQPQFKLDGCTFDNVAVYYEDGYLFYDESYTSHATIESTTFQNSDTYFYYSAHYMPAQITMKNVTVSTSKLASTSSNSSSEWGGTTEYALFEFDSVDEVDIHGLTVNYSYDMGNCELVDTITNYDIWGTKANSFECTNPAMFIINNGQVMCYFVFDCHVGVMSVSKSVACRVTF